MPISLAVIGANGKMGKRVLSLALSDPEFTISSVCIRKEAKHDLEDLINLLDNSSEDAFKKADVGIDFSSPLATSANIRAALLHKKPIVIGTTGITQEIELLISQASLHIPILYSPNFSFGMALCLEMAAKLGKHLKGSVEIIETHHELKKDSPSGTALALAKSIGDPKAEIRSIRSGETIGEHRVIFSCEGERIELKHEALSRNAFAKGALLAAKFLSRQSPGLYSVKDLFS